MVESFLKAATGSKEASLLIAETENQITGIEASLAEAGFIKNTHPVKLLQAIHKHQKAYSILDEANAKDLYDICTQYPTGHISVLNRSKMVPLFIRPRYEESAVVIVVSAQILLALEKQGYTFRSVTGMAHQA